MCDFFYLISMMNVDIYWLKKSISYSVIEGATKPVNKYDSMWSKMRNETISSK